MTLQEIYDAVVLHLATQGRPAMDEDGNCLYRGPGKTKCAVGCLIPDEMYDPVMDSGGGKSITDLVLHKQYSLPEYFYVGEVEELLTDLQAAHDFWTMGGDTGLAEELNRIAGKYGLDNTAVRNGFPRYFED